MENGGDFNGCCSFSESEVTWQPLKRRRTFEVVPEAAKFREREPMLMAEQEILFSDVVATGRSAWTLSSGLLPPHMRDEQERPFQNVGNDDTTNDLTADLDAPLPSQNENGPAQRSRRITNEIASGVKQRRRKKMSTGERIARALERLVDKIIEDSTSSRASSGSACNVTISDCLEILNKLPGVEKGSSLWMYATRVFLKPPVRELFACLKKDELRVRWLQAQMERDMQRKSSSIFSAQASHGYSHGYSHDNENASSG